MVNIDHDTISVRTETEGPSKLVVVCNKISKLTVTIITLAAELAIVAVVGATVGNYMTAKTIIADCQRVSLSKVGDSYIQCTVVEPKKDAPTAPPR